MKTSGAPLAAFFLAAVLALGAPCACAPVHAMDTAAPAASAVTASLHTPLASFEGFKNWFMAHVITTFSFRERMIQMLAVGLFIGLFVMLRKMPGQT